MSEGATALRLPASVRRFGVLVSGRGSNMVALADAAAGGRVPAVLALVVSNVAGAPALERARERGIETLVLDHRGRARAEHDADVARALEDAGCEACCLAGYMRLLSKPFVRRFAGRMLNVHPSLLPAFPGLHAQRQALEHGAKVSGATVHLVDEELDHGPIVLQEAVPVLDDDDEASLSARILEAEHRIYPEALRRLCEGRLHLDGRRVLTR